MPLEDLTGPNKYIADLVREWPLGIDPFSEGDDHVRGLKNTLKNTFPTAAEPRRPVSFREGDDKAAELVSAMELPSGTALQRPSTPSMYDLRVLDDGRLEWWDGSAWVPAVAMLRQDNVRVGEAGAVASPTDQWSANRVPQANDIGPTLVFNTGDGPGGVNMGSLRWQVSPNDAGRMRLAIRRNNGGFGNALVIGGGVMVPTADNPQDAEDLGRGWLNAKLGLAVDGVGVHGRQDPVALSGNLVTLDSSVPALAQRITVSVEGMRAAGSDNDPYLRIGPDAGLEIAGYIYGSSRLRNNQAVTAGTFGDGFNFAWGNASDSEDLTGVLQLVRMNDAGTLWGFSSSMGGAGGRTYAANGSKLLAGQLSQVAIKCGRGAVSFTAGSATVMYEM